MNSIPGTIQFRSRAALRYRLRLGDELRVALARELASVWKATGHYAKSPNHQRRDSRDTPERDRYDNALCTNPTRGKKKKKQSS